MRIKFVLCLSLIATFIPFTSLLAMQSFGQQKQKNFCISYQNQSCYISYQKIKNNISPFKDHKLDLDPEKFSHDQANEIFGFFVSYNHWGIDPIKKGASITRTVFLFCNEHGIKLA